MTFFVCHLLACAWGLVAMQADDKGSWYNEYTDLSHEDRVIRHWRKQRQYVACVYWAMTTMTTVGYGTKIWGVSRGPRMILKIPPPS